MHRLAQLDSASSSFAAARPASSGSVASASLTIAGTTEPGSGPGRAAAARGAGSLPWQRSSFCRGAADTCVDVQLGPAGVGVRDSKDLDGPVLRFTPEEWEAFLCGVRNGEFELPPG